MVIKDENTLPNQPLTAFFTLQVCLPASGVFTALREANVDSKMYHVSNVLVMVKSS